HVAVAFDNPIRSFRNELFEGYKTDEGVPKALLAQFDAAERAVSVLGMVVWSMKQWEADDAIATAAARWSTSVDQVRILSPDKDLGNVATGRGWVWWIGAARKSWTSRVCGSCAASAHRASPIGLPWSEIRRMASQGSRALASGRPRFCSLVFGTWKIF